MAWYDANAEARYERVAPERLHVAPKDRPRAFHTLSDLLKPGGLSVLSLRHGPLRPLARCHPAAADEIRRLARHHGAFVGRCIADKNHLGRPDLRWTRMALRRPR